jgi:hypothetical protein
MCLKTDPGNEGFHRFFNRWGDVCEMQIALIGATNVASFDWPINPFARAEKGDFKDLAERWPGRRKSGSSLNMLKPPTNLPMVS